MNNFPFLLKDKYILVTGASSGIGRAISILISKMGANVILTGRNFIKLNETFSAMKCANHLIFPADLSNNNDVVDLVNKVPHIDGLVHNAGIGIRVLCKDIREHDINEVFKINFQAPLLLQSLLLSNKKINNNSSIVFIASRAAEFPSIGNALYSASKGAIISYAKCLALELAIRKIRVNCILPAMVQTDFIEKSGIDQEIMDNLNRSYPLKRCGQPIDIANLCLYLLSDASSWMTGSCINISGGGEGILC